MSNICLVTTMFPSAKERLVLPIYCFSVIATSPGEISIRACGTVPLPVV